MPPAPLLAAEAEAAHRGRPGWRSTAILFALAGVAESMGFGHFGAFTPVYLAQLHVPASAIPLWTGLLGAIGWSIGLPLIPFWGVWADKYSRKLVIVRSSYVEAVMFGLAAASQSVWMLALARFLSGLVVGNTGVMFAVQADRTPAAHLGWAVSIISAASPVGMAIGPYLGSVVIGAASIRALLALDGVLCLAAGVAMTLVLEDHRPQRPTPQATAVMVRQAVAAVRSSPFVVRLFALSFLASLAGSVVQPYTPLLIQALYRGAGVVAAIGAILTASGILLAVGTPLWGRAGDRWGHRRTLSLCTGLSALAAAGQALAATLAAFVGFRLVQSLFTGGITTMSTTLIARGAPADTRASILNFSLVPLQLSWFVGPLCGAIVSGLSGVGGAFWLAAAAAAAAFVMAVAGQRPSGRLAADANGEAPAV